MANGRDSIPIIIYALISLLVMQGFFTPGYILLLDLQWGPNSLADFQFSDFYGYNFEEYGAVLPLKLVLAAASDIIPVELLHKIFYFFILFFCGASMHFALPKKYGNVRYFGALFYMLNPFVFVRFLAGHWALLLGYALWPMAINFFSDFLKMPNNRNLIRMVLITFLVSINIHALLMLLIIYLMLFLHSKFSIELVKQTFVAAGLVILLNLFWIAPTLLLFEDRYSPASAELYLEDFGAEGGLFSILSLHGFWREGFTYTKDVFDSWFFVFLILLAIVAFGSIQMLKANSPFAIPFYYVFIIALFLTLGESNPFFWLLEPIKEMLFFAFRDTQKFVALIALVYSMAAAFGVYKLSKNLPVALLIMLFFLPIIYNFGFFGVLGQISPTQYPSDWYDAEKIISSDDAKANILILPPNLYREYDWVNGTQKTLGTPHAQFFSRPVITTIGIETKNIKKDQISSYSEHISYILENSHIINNTAEQLLLMDVRYIILFKNEVNAPHYLHLFYRKDGVDNIEVLYESDSLYLFRNNIVFGELVSTDGSKLGNVTYQEIHPGKFRILDSDYDTVLFLKHNKMEFNGKTTESWKGLAQQFTFSKDGILANPIFPMVLSLFLFSWFLTILLIIKFDLIRAGALAILYVLFYLSIDGGLVAPHHIGWLIIFSLILVFLQKKPTFINL